MFSPHSSRINFLGLLIVFVTAAVILADRLTNITELRPVTNLLYTWVLLLSGFALLLGIAGLVWIHVERIQRGEVEWPLSLLLLIGFFGVLLTGLVSAGGTISPVVEWIFDAIIAPGQASLFALTGFFIMVAAYRYLRLDRPDALWILAGALLAFLVQTPLTQQALPSILVDLADWLLVWPVMAALRGALLGGALAVLLVGLRLLVRSEK
jgi:hypothetical protein